jgi:asparagine synthase (glutamine-hydrolysing)
MCGFTGFIDFDRNSSESNYRTVLNRMNDLLTHRGPDDDGLWVDEKKGIALGHRRLSIIDLSADGHQPMISQSGRFVIVYNGEIYNYKEIGERLKKTGFQFKGHSDTEVILEYIERHGIYRAVEDFIGMFAFAVLDRREGKLYLVRDRIGIKPLFYSLNSSGLTFASELKPIMESGKIDKKIDVNSLSEFFRYRYICAPNTIFENVFKLYPGSVFEYDINNNDHTINKYWDAKKVFSQSSKKSTYSSKNEAIEALKNQVDDAVKGRMIADVPLGAFLSGGIDSSLIVATMQKFSNNPVNTFAIGYENTKYNEATHAKEVANYLGTNHTELYVSDKEAREIIPDLPQMWDEPFGDSSQIPTYFVSKLAKKHVTVSLSGDGGDELFGGYHRYYNANDTWNKIKRIPYPLRKRVGAVLKSIPDDTMRAGTFMGRINKFSMALAEPTKSKMYDNWRSGWNDIEGLFNVPVNGDRDNKLKEIPVDNFIEQMMGLDLIAYIPNDILTKVDRASMANSLEVRVPLLDHRIVEFACKLPLEYKFSSNQPKWILRQLLYQYVPPKLLDRPKMGFRTPVEEWIKGPLKNWATDLLSDQELSKHGFLNNEFIHHAMKQHIENDKDFTSVLWNALMFQSWYNCWMD